MWLGNEKFNCHHYSTLEDFLILLFFGVQIYIFIVTILYISQYLLFGLFTKFIGNVRSNAIS